MKPIEMPAGVRVLGPVSAAQTKILSPDALAFFATLHREFNPRRLELLRQRKLRQEALDRGEMPRFLTETTSVREDGWRVRSEEHTSELQSHSFISYAVFS